MIIKIGKWRILIKIFKIKYNENIQWYDNQRMYWNEWEKYTNNQ